MLNRLGPVFAIILALLPVPPAHAQTETPIAIQVTAQSGNPLAAIAGETQISLRSKESGEVIASGQTYQGKFEVSLDLPRPTLTTISVTGPLASLSSLITVSRDVLLIPGKDYSADGGIGVTLPGMIVRLLTPAPDQTIAKPDDDIIVTAYIVGLDGQPLAPGTHDTDVVVYMGSMVSGSAKMVPAGQPGRFLAKLKFPHPGTYSIIVSAYDPVSKSAAMDQGIFIAPENATTPSEQAKSKK